MFDTSEIAGFIASILVLITFAMKDMRLLRVTAIFSNVAFVIYGAMQHLVPVLLLHVILLPLNIRRLMQARGKAVYPSPRRSAAYVDEASVLFRQNVSNGPRPHP